MQMGIVESLIMDSLPIPDMNPRVLRIPSGNGNRPAHKRHGKPAYSDGTACKRSKKACDRAFAASVIDHDYVSSARAMEQKAIMAARKVYLKEYRTTRLLACYALDDFVGIAIVRREGYVVWRPYSPITGAFGQAEIVPSRSHGLNDGDVRHLAGYCLDDPVRIVSLH